MSNEKPNQLRTVSLVIIITLVGKVMGLGREVLMGYAFGIGIEADALAGATQIPRIFFDSVFASAISSSFIPVFNEYMERKGKGEAFHLAGSFLTIMGIATAVMSVLGIVFAPQLTGLMTKFSDPAATELCTQLLKVIFPTVFFTGIAFSLVGILQSLGEFNIPAAMSIVSNGVLIVYYLVLSGRYGVFGAAGAMLVGWALQALFQFPSLRKRGFSFKFGLWHPGLKQIFALMLPVMVSTWIQPINQMVVNRFASSIDGGVSALTYANNIYIMIASIFVLSVTNVVFPEMSRLSATGEKGRFSQMINETTRTLLFFLIPMTVGLMLLSTPIIRLFYERGNFGADGTALTSTILFYMSIGMVGYGIQNVLFRAFYAVGNGRVPMVCGIVSIGVNLLLCTLLMDRYGAAGLAISTAVASLAAAVMLLIPTHRLTGEFLSPALVVSVLKMGAAAVAMGLVVYLLRDAVLARAGAGLLGQVLVLGIPTAAGLVIYMVIARILRIEEAEQVFRLLGKLRKGGR